jgi:hypothetical protein
MAAKKRISRTTGKPVRPYRRRDDEAQEPAPRARRGKAKGRRSAAKGPAREMVPALASHRAKTKTPARHEQRDAAAREGANLRAMLEAAGLMLPGVTGLVVAEPAQVRAHFVKLDEQRRAEEAARAEAARVEAEKQAALAASKAAEAQERAAKAAAEAAAQTPAEDEPTAGEE